jgi:hypothetical protein
MRVTGNWRITFAWDDAPMPSPSIWRITIDDRAEWATYNRTRLTWLHGQTTPA